MSSHTTAPAQQNIDSVLQEKRLFPPSPEFSKHAHIKSMAEYEKIYAQAAADPEAFWAGIARELHWFKPFTQVLDWSNPPFAKWFADGKINISFNCLDRHVQSWRKNKAALIWESEPGEVRTGDQQHTSYARRQQCADCPD